MCNSGSTGILRIRKWIENEIEERDRRWSGIFTSTPPLTGISPEKLADECMEFVEAALREERPPIWNTNMG